jgi:23S rRNA (uracil747-C5)-methyltransferase
MKKLSCPYYLKKTCQSCSLLEIEYPEQILLKENKLKNDLQHFVVPLFEQSVTSDIQNFRNKAKFIVSGSLDHPIIGIVNPLDFEQGHELLECPIHVNKINQILPHLIHFIKLARIAPYSISKKEGELKGLIIYFNELSEQGYVRFILRSEESVSRIIKFIPHLLDSCPQFQVVSANIQPVAHAILEGEKEIYLTSNHFIEIKTELTHYFISPKGFIQTNEKVAQLLYQEAAKWAKSCGVKKMVDLYSGQGSFSFACSDELDECLGIEINSEAVKSAQKTAEKIKKPNIKFICLSADEIKNELDIFKPDLILVNPPRAGLKNAINDILHHAPKYLIYSSCHSESLAIDLHKLVEKYHIKKIKMFDMFPHSEHFETLVLLENHRG